jgi:hypothetical protein
VINPARWRLALGATLALSVGSLAPALVAGESVAAPVAATSVVSASSARTPVPSRWQARQAAMARKLGLERSSARVALDRALDPDDYVCGPTDLDPYITGILKGMTDSDITFLVESGALDFPTYEALFFGSDTDPRYALPADYRTQLTHTFRDAQRFWDIKSGDIELHAMHGSMLTDPARITRVLVRVFGFEQQDAVDYARFIARRVATTPAFEGGDNPIFTLNAFAFTTEEEGDPELFAGVPDKLIFGDGILDAFSALGMTDVAPRAVLAHEFGHHVQFEDHLFDSRLTGAEATRRTELMADAMGTYFLTHSRGLSLNTRRVLEAEKSFYEVGDCAFEDPNHHGTPNQRLRASTWGARLAMSAQKQGHILPSLTVARRFDNALAAIVAPDAS